MQTLRDEQLAVLQQVQPELEHADVAMDQSDSYFGGNEGAGAPDMDMCTRAPNMNTLLIDDEWVEDGTLKRANFRLQPLHTVLRNCTLIWRSSTSWWGSRLILGMDISQQLARAHPL